MQLLTLTCADPSAMSCLGRFNPDHMDDQTRMELLLGDRKMSRASKRSFKDPTGEFRDVKEWLYVKFDESDAVNEIDWSYSGMHGGIETQYIPPTVRNFNMSGNRLKGTINWQTLPRALCRFCIDFNQLSGSVDFSHLPENLSELYIGWNKFSGSVDLAGITQSIRTLKFSGNRFSGELDLNHLPMEAKVSHDATFSPILGHREQIV